MRTHSIALLLIASSSLATPALAQDTQAPTAVPEAQAAVPYGSVLLLSGARSSDPGGQIALYTWTRLEGEGGEFPPNQPRATDLPSFVLAQHPGNPYRPGRHRFRLQVTDDSGNVSQPADVQFIVVDDIPPVAIVGALASIYHGQSLQLRGEHSADIPGRVVRWRWTRLQGGGGDIMPLNQAFETADGSYQVQQYAGHFLAPGQHVFRLVVVDDAGNPSAPRDFAVNVISTADTTAPTAVLDTPNSVGIGAPLTLSGARSSDAGGQVVRWVWTRLEGGGGANMPLNQAIETQTATLAVPQPAGAPLAIGRHRFRLVVTDNSGNQSQPTDRQVIVVDNIAPTAVIEAPREILPREAFQLSAARSGDVGGRIVGYRWTRISGSREGPMGLNQMLETTEPVLKVPESGANPYALGRQVFRLVVVDDSGNPSQPADFAVNVVAKR